MTMTPDQRESQIQMQRSSMQYGEVHYESGSFEPGVITGWFGTLNLSAGKARQNSNPFTPQAEAAKANTPAIIVLSDVNTPAAEQQIRMIPMGRVLWIDQAAAE